MRYTNKNIVSWQVQLLIWLGVLLLSFLSNMQFDGVSQSSSFAVIATFFYAVIIYANAGWFIPAYYYTKKYVLYVVCIVMLLLTVVVARTLLFAWVYNTFYAIKPEALTVKSFTYSIFSCVFILIFSYFFRLALNFFTLSKKQVEITAQKAQTELSLLKQQLHPHFLFNTLNNIYYVAGKDSPEAADLIERLSGIMRYFIEEAKKEKVFLKDEIALLKSYIELESIRMRYEMPVQFEISDNISSAIIPPLLLMPLVENIFKHGVDKRSKKNFAEIQLKVADSKLFFNTKNRCYPSTNTATGKTGLANLEKRLQLYYEGNYTLIAKQQEELFIAELQIPIDEN